MDADRFDALSRVLGTQSRRRGMFKAAAGGALGLVGLAGLTDRASARRCSKDNDCSRNDVCKSGNCVECKSDKNCSGKDVCSRDKCVECERNKDCKSNQRCQNQRCKQK